MSKHLEGLVPEFREKVETYLEWLKADRGVIMVPFFGLRTPMEQATLWRRSRTRAEVQAGIARLKAQGAPWLASLLENGKPADGPWATNALPGQSWHQFGLAVDCYWQVNGKPTWDTKSKLGHAMNGYQVYATWAQKFGMHSLISIGDAVHIQNVTASSPMKNMSMAEIDKLMRDKFEAKAPSKPGPKPKAK